MPFLLPIFDPATYDARGVISVTDTATRTRQRGCDAPLGGQATDAASLSDYEKSLSNCERDGGSVASARDADAVVPFVVSYRHHHYFMSCWSGMGRSIMSKSSKRDGVARRGPDNVTEIRKGGYVLVVSGYYKEGGTETALNKMAAGVDTGKRTERNSPDTGVKLRRIRMKP